MDFISFRRNEWSLGRSLAAAPPPLRNSAARGFPVVRIAGSRQENVQNGDELYSLSYKYRVVLPTFFLLDAITTSFQTRGILLLFVFPITKVLQRLGLLRRIKYFLPRDIRELLVKSTIIPLLDYADVTWGDTANLTLMKKVQVLQNLAAKFVLDMPRHSSATEALHQLGWDNLMERRRLHRLILFFKALNGLIVWDFNLYSFKDIHNYNTRGRNDISIY